MLSLIFIILFFAIITAAAGFLIVTAIQDGKRP